VDYNPHVRCALCGAVGFVVRYCPCTKAGERRLRELAERLRG
jgi:ribosomal protein L37E